MTHECQPRTVYVREQTDAGRRWKAIGTACPECFTSGLTPAQTIEAEVGARAAGYAPPEHSPNCRCLSCRQGG